MTQPPVVYVRWHDSMTGVGGWHTIPDAERFAAEAWAEPMLAAGFLILDRDDYIVIASGFNPAREGDPDVNGTVMIPRSEIVTLVHLGPER